MDITSGKDQEQKDHRFNALAAHSRCSAATSKKPYLKS